MALALSCPDCRTEVRTRELPPGVAVVCPACGAGMVVPGLPVLGLLPEQDHAPYAETEPEPAQPPSYYSEPPRRRRINPLVITAVAVVPLLILGAVLIYLLTVVAADSKKPPAESASAQAATPTGPAARPQVNRPEADDPPMGAAEADRGRESADAGLGEAAGTVVAVGMALALYLFPTAVALCRGHTNLPGVFVLNFFLGWTGWFWVLALVW